MNSQSFKIGMVRNAVALWGGLLLFGLCAHAATYTNNNPVNEEIDWNNAPATTGVGDSNYSATNSTTLWVGQLNGSSAQRLEKEVFTFQNPTLSDGEQIVVATLYIYVATIQNPDGTLGDLNLYNSKTQNHTYAYKGFYQDTSYKDTGLIVATPTSTAGYVALDVTSFINADYADDGASVISSFRLQVNGISYNAAGGNDAYGISNKYSAHPTYLVITTEAIPEPGAIALWGGLACGVVSVILRRRGRR